MERTQKIYEFMNDAAYLPNKVKEDRRAKIAYAIGYHAFKKIAADKNHKKEILEKCNARCNKYGLDNTYIMKGYERAKFDSEKEINIFSVKKKYGPFSHQISTSKDLFQILNGMRNNSRLVPQWAFEEDK